MNLRPPGPQPGALPDCATPRGLAMIARGDAGEPLGWLQETAAAADNGRMRQTGDVCARADEATRLVAGELSGQERAAYVEHTESCERCAERVSALRGADGLGAVIAREL